MTPPRRSSRFALDHARFAVPRDVSVAETCCRCHLQLIHLGLYCVGIAYSLYCRHWLEVERLSALTDHSRDVDPTDLLLAAYSAGGLDPALQALVASHLMMSPRSRSFVRALDELAGLELESIAPVPLSDRDRMLAAVFASDLMPDRSGRLRTARPGAIVLPEPLRDYLGCELDDLRWKTLLPGVREHVIERKGRGDAKLLWAKAGRKMPRHTHEGSEVTLVVHGAFRDATGLYAKGDIVIAESDLDHQPVTEPEADCICFAVTDAPLHLTGPFGRIMDLFLTQR
jgi:putative transcriptional regulator